MRGLLKWIFIAILVVVILLILVNVANKTKTKPKTSAPPTVYEKSKKSNTDSDKEDDLVPISDNNNLEQSVQVSDTASFSTVCVFIGMFILAGGAYYIYKRQIN